ncbi:DsbA family protein [Candidatus Micrarchaeota archaeon]|nr:DsbA family protein [Candidatus Micrarchaeota archaeon]
MEEHAHHKKEDGLYAVAIAMIVSVLILSGVLVYATNGINSNLQQINSNIGNIKLNVVNNGGGAQGTVAATPIPSQQPSAPNFKLEGVAFKGKESAPITIIEYSDFQCPFCSRFYAETLPSILKDWVDTGKAKLYYKHFPLSQIHPNAEKAAEASECAKDQGKFWEMHDKMFQNGNALSVDDLKRYAADLKLDTAKFNTCLDGGSKASIVAEQLQEGIGAGVTGTPSFFINGQNIVGAQPYSVFQQVLQSYA